MSSEIVRHQQRDPVALGQVLSQSGYFSDAKQAAQAAVKVMAGEEVGLGPVASMTGVHIVNGKVTMGANIIAALVRRHRDYDYTVTEHTDQVCTIQFTYKGKPAGTSSFNMDDAKKAGLLGKTGPWTQHPRNMLFARAMSNGAKWYAPDVSAGAPLYTPEELGADVQYDQGGEIVSVRVDEPVVQVAPAPVAPAAAAVSGDDDTEASPFDPKQVITMLKDQFGAEVVKDAFNAAGITRFSDLTPEKADAITQQLEMGEVAA